MTQTFAVSSGSVVDQKLVHGLVGELPKQGVRAVLTSKAANPEKRRTAVTELMRKSDGLVIVVLDPSQGLSPWAEFEAGSMAALSRPLIVVLPEVYSAGDLPPVLKGSHVVFGDIRNPKDVARKVSAAISNAEEKVA